MEPAVVEPEVDAELGLDATCDAFLAEHFQHFRLLPALLKAIKRKFPKRKYPQKDMRKAFQCLEIMLDTIGDGKAADVLADFLATSHHQDMKKRVADADQHTESIIDKIKVMLSDLHDAGSKKKVNPALNSVRINLPKLLLDIPGMGRKKLLDASWITMTVCCIRHELASGLRLV